MEEYREDKGPLQSYIYCLDSLIVEGSYHDEHKRHITVNNWYCMPEGTETIDNLPIHCKTASAAMRTFQLDWFGLGHA